jgi:hypothetical protein
VKLQKRSQADEMPMPVTRAPQTTPEAQLRGFIAKFDACNQALIRAVRRAVRKRLPTATELVYDNYNFFVIGYSPTLRPSDAVLSIAAGANGVGLCFIQGARLPDPKKILQGSGNQSASSGSSRRPSSHGRKSSR